MSQRGIGSHTKPNNGAKDEWLTPPHVLEALGEFDLDPCAPVNRPWPMAKQHFTVADDGLSRDWFGRVWLNPPYGQQTGQWLQKLAAHGNGIALVFARTETEMFFEHVWPRADAFLFLQGRLHFHDVKGTRAKGNAGGPSVLIAYGQNNAAILEECDLLGMYLTK